ncbi:hypothetical protein [Bradyrhizobium sp. CB3481]|uniref:hypothetical protein n=1 Tax=Bradyrhizobium sp. CB3481 TaxID=3039158 RepID=UPI0024B08A56|nr:hypothetical protein [Bradyrhizobium sp. CB3481]WFU14484.1 hypothetical protein QA643_25300 [Bradyrhizobium sp. CB3481]
MAVPRFHSQRSAESKVRLLQRAGRTSALAAGDDQAGFVNKNWIGESKSTIGYAVDLILECVWLLRWFGV